VLGTEKCFALKYFLLSLIVSFGNNCQPGWTEASSQGVALGFSVQLQEIAHCPLLQTLHTA